jgi:hypothetical protein
MKRLLLVLVAAALGAGCEGAATRAWQSAELPTHDRQRAFDSARGVLAGHFEIARANYAQGTIETKPQVFDRERSGTLADLRGAGGRWRRTVSFELSRGGLAMTGRAAVRLEREATAAAVAIAESGGYEPVAADGPPSRLPGAQPGAKTGGDVWVEVGYDAPLAREILAEIAQQIAQAEKGETRPEVPTAKDAEDARK